MTARRGSMLVMSLFLSAGSALAQNHVNPVPTTPPLPTNVIMWMFIGGIGAISITWVLVPWIFASRDKLDDLVDLLREGAVMRFVTVTYIVIVAVTLAIVDRLDGDKVSTLLASIAGYVLGQATIAKREERADAKEAKEAKETRRAAAAAEQSSLVRTDERPRPAQ